LAYQVAEQRQEIGVRVALGASPGRVLRAIVGHGMLLASIGVAGGLAAALVLTRWMQGVLFGIEPSDPLTLLQVSLVMAASALLASWLPARRALAVDPATALRQT
jgi:putative ABC transport system permease protein